MFSSCSITAFCLAEKKGPVALRLAWPFTAVQDNGGASKMPILVQLVGPAQVTG